MKKHIFYKVSEEAFAAMHDAIVGAEKSIYWETYIIKDDTFPAYDFFNHFIAKARAGVSVKLIIDRFGSYWYEFPKKLEVELREAGVELLYFGDILRHVHRKILVVDERVAFVGGVNVGKSFAKWLDLHMRLTESHMVKSILKTFSRAYRIAGGTDQKILSTKKPRKKLKPEMWLVEHWPIRKRYKLRKMYEDKINRAQKRIVFVTPYFAPHQWLAKSIQAARHRDVAIDIILPFNAESEILTLANHYYSAKLQPLGINFYFTRDMLHAKALLIDDNEGMIGSNNLDPQSFDWNVETGVIFKNKAMVSDLKSIIDEWKEHATQTMRPKKVYWYQIPMLLIMKLIGPLL